MGNPSANSVERRGFATLVACLLAPMLAQGLWRPLEHVLGGAGGARPISVAALVIGAIAASAPGISRSRPAWYAAAAAGLLAVGVSVGLSLGAAGLGALLPVVAMSVCVSHWLPSRLPPSIDGLIRRHRGLSLVYVLVALATVVQTTRVTVFIGDPTAVDDQALPGETFVETHSCLSAYVRASQLARQGVDNLYSDDWWHGSHGLPPLPPGVENPYAPFHLDNFSYPPPFLLLVSPLALLDGDFLAQRALWFGLNGALAAFGLWIVARWVEGPAAHRVLLLAPLLLGSVPFLLTLQIGNFHLAGVVVSLLAMIALDRGRTPVGGALLATAILSKISPGILGVVLLVQRRVRASIVAAGFGVLLLGLSVLRFGTNPIQSFVTFALPRLSSGAAFPFMDTVAGIVTNTSPFGIAFKLRFLGFDIGDPWQVGARIAHVYTVVLLLLALIGARRSGDRRDQALRWMALLTLAALQSPFCAAYGTLGLLWATTLLAVEVRRAWGALALCALWPAILLVPPGFEPAQKATLSIAQTALTIGVCAWLLVRAAPSATIQPESR